MWDGPRITSQAACYIRVHIMLPNEVIVVEFSSIPIIWHHYSTSCTSNDGHLIVKWQTSKIGSKRMPSLPHFPIEFHRQLNRERRERYFIWSENCRNQKNLVAIAPNFRVRVFFVCSEEREREWDIERRGGPRGIACGFPIIPLFLLYFRFCMKKLWRN